jgi:pimeloyl-ACP methyl ester carboxylesterase
MTNIIFIHGLESSGQGFKAQLFQKVLPGIITPNFREYSSEISYRDLLKERMNQLNSILKEKEPWIIIGSSFGGLMGALYACKFPNRVSLLILLAPFLKTPDLDPKNFHSINIPVIIFHGKHDQIVSLKASRSRAKKLFKNLTYNIVDDDHMLHSTVLKIDWPHLVGISNLS